MAEVSLYQINQNDERPDIIRKVNANFKNLGFAQAKKIKQASLSVDEGWSGAINDLATSISKQFADQEKRMLGFQKEIDALKSKDKAIQELIDQIPSRIYPVGSIFMSAVSDDPKASFGGEWKLLSSKPLWFDDQQGANNIYTWQRIG